MFQIQQKIILGLKEKYQWKEKCSSFTRKCFHLNTVGSFSHLQCSNKYHLGSTLLKPMPYYASPTFHKNNLLHNIKAKIISFIHLFLTCLPPLIGSLFWLVVTYNSLPSLPWFAVTSTHSRLVITYSSLPSLPDPLSLHIILIFHPIRRYLHCISLSF